MGPVPVTLFLQRLYCHPSGYLVLVHLHQLDCLVHSLPPSGALKLHWVLGDVCRGGAQSRSGTLPIGVASMREVLSTLQVKSLRKRLVIRLKNMVHSFPIRGKHQN